MKVSISPWTRNDLIGFRCIRYVDDTLKQQLTQNFKQPNRDYQNLQPVSDEVFEVYKELFKLNDPDLDPVIISKSESTYWTEETVSIDVPYENAPMKILLFIPVDYKPPYQTIVYMPGINAIYSNSMDDMSTDNIDFFIKSGRAVVWPVYYSTFGRGAIKPTNLYTWKQVHKNIMIDFQIACDYLQTRNDIDTDKLAYFGVSWGGALAAYLLAIDDKIKLGILSLFGISSLEKYTYKEFDQIDYVPHIKIPMLLLGGRYDPDYVMEQQKAFYDFLGTPESNKKWIIYESTHWIPREDLINESLSWLDKYFGPPPG
jgi:dienelactone hydrolase